MRWPNRPPTWARPASPLCGAHAQVLSAAELTASQRRQLDDEAGLVGAVMEATATLTVGTVTAGAHA